MRGGLVEPCALLPVGHPVRQGQLGVVLPGCGAGKFRGGAASGRGVGGAYSSHAPCGGLIDILTGHRRDAGHQVAALGMPRPQGLAGPQVSAGVSRYRAGQPTGGQVHRLRARPCPGHRGVRGLVHSLGFGDPRIRPSALQRGRAGPSRHTHVPVRAGPGRRAGPGPGKPVSAPRPTQTGRGEVHRFLSGGAGGEVHRGGRVCIGGGAGGR